MEVLVGPTFGIDVSSAAGYVRARSSGEDPNGVVAVTREIGSSLGMAGSVKTPLQPVDDDESSESSSSIGAPGDTDDDDDDEDEVDSSKSSEGKFGRKFGSFGSLEDALPIKRGLSNHFTGKSKSFANLAEVSSFNVKEVEKQENPFNKRRRILIQSRLARKRFYSSFNPKSMPLLPVDENDTSDRDYSDQDEQDRQDEKDDEVSSSSSSDEKERQHSFGRGQQMQQFRLQRLHDRKLGTFKSHSCFALSDLQEEEDL